jgi:hypothetical protein
MSANVKRVQRLPAYTAAVKTHAALLKASLVGLLFVMEFH